MKKEKETICPVCLNAILLNFNPGDYSKCKTCKVVFQNPIPTETELTKLYENYYHVANKNANVGYENYEENRSPLIFERNYIPWIKKYAKNKCGRILDFGCGTGNLVIALKNNGYVNTEGCEFASDAFQPLQEKNISCFECKELKNKDKKYSAITMVDVIEHLREPKKDLANIYDSLELGGIIFIETINIDDFFVQHFHKERWIGIAPAHTFLWGVTSLKKILEQNNFKILEIKTYRISGSFIKRMTILILSPFLKNIREKHKNSLYQLTFGDGIRIVAQK